MSEDSPTTKSLNAVTNTDDGPVVAVGDEGAVILRGPGGGWELQNSGVSEHLYGIAFAEDDASVAVAVGANGSIVRTADGGRQWSSADSGVVVELRGVVLGYPASAVAVGEGAILVSTDGGSTWGQPDVLDVGRLLVVASQPFLGPGNMLVSRFLAAGAAGEVWLSQDAGSSWTRTEAGIDADIVGLASVSFVSGYEDSFLVSDSGGDIWLAKGTSDGLTWERLSEAASGGGSGLAVQGTWLLSQDGSVSWLEDGERTATVNKDVLAVKSPMRAITGVSSDAFVVGVEGAILHAELQQDDCLGRR